MFLGCLGGAGHKSADTSRALVPKPQSLVGTLCYSRSRKATSAVPRSGTAPLQPQRLFFPPGTVGRIILLSPRTSFTTKTPPSPHYRTAHHHRFHPDHDSKPPHSKPIPDSSLPNIDSEHLSPASASRPSILPPPVASPSSLCRFHNARVPPSSHFPSLRQPSPRFSRPPHRFSLLPPAHVLLLLRDSSPRRPLVTTPRPRFPFSGTPVAISLDG